MVPEAALQRQLSMSLLPVKRYWVGTNNTITTSHLRQPCKTCFRKDHTPTARHKLQLEGVSQTSAQISARRIHRDYSASSNTYPSPLTRPTHHIYTTWTTKIAPDPSSVVAVSPRKKPPTPTVASACANSPSKPSTSTKTPTSSRTTSDPSSAVSA